MKPYFPKFLPVEGEIKELDYYKHEDYNGVLFRFYEPWDDKKEKAQKVKLFLCSRHTECPKCGERENLHDNLDYSKEELPIIETLCNECGTFFDYEVIGEISPDAIWVKEGDEFNEDDFYIKDECPHYNGKHM